jgi:hypothetical protein
MNQLLCVLTDFDKSISIALKKALPSSAHGFCKKHLRTDLEVNHKNLLISTI